MPNSISPDREGTEPNANSDVAIRLSNVRKVYRLYSSPTEQAIDALGLSRVIFWRRNREHAEFSALDGINLEVRLGERVAIVGRNGAGKTTMLKLVSGNFLSTSGNVDVNGRVQALMQTGLGFHPEFTGRANIQASLLYNGLSQADYQAAMEEVVEFVELGDFLDQPMKTYSSGMQARLQFACATAVRPDILIIDEVLGAGDAYFSAKSADRIQQLAKSGCTLLLVSHSMQQVLQFCERAVWVEQGRVVADGEALSIVKAYERNMFERRRETRKEIRSEHRARANSPRIEEGGGDVGVSRWTQPSSPLTIRSVRLLDADGNECSGFETGEKVEIEIIVEATENGEWPCRFLLLIFNESGVRVTWHLSGEYRLSLASGASAKVRLSYDQLLLCAGQYVVSAAIYALYDPLNKSSAKCYDLLSRSFEFHVADDFSGNPAIINHPAHWHAADVSH